MADNVSEEVRSRTMRAVRGRDTSPEIALRRSLREHGLRGYRVSPRGILGVPDVAYVGLRLAVFVDGCYWHGCPKHCRRPTSNTGYWNQKIEKNIERDSRISAALTEQGWTVLRFWEHELKKEPAKITQIVVDSVRLLKDRRKIRA